jgi:hypothetical protein
MPETGILNNVAMVAAVCNFVMMPVSVAAPLLLP